MQITRASYSWKYIITHEVIVEFFIELHDATLTAHFYHLEFSGRQAVDNRNNAL